MKKIDEILEQYMVDLKTPEENYFQTPISELNRFFNCSMDGRMMLVASRTHVGKTSFALDISYHYAKVKELPVLYFTTDESEVSITQKLILKHSFHSEKKLNFKDIASRTNMEIIEQASKDISDLPFYIFEREHLSVDNISDCIINTDVNFGLIVIDTIDKVVSEEEWSRHEALEDILEEVKSLSYGFCDCPILILTKIEPKKKTNKNFQPTISDISYIDAIRDHVDSILIIHRESFYRGNMNSEIDFVDIAIPKNKYGDDGYCKISFSKASATFLDFSPSSYFRNGTRKI